MDPLVFWAGIWTDTGQRSWPRIRSVLTQSNDISVNYTVEDLVGMGRYPHYENRPQEKDLSIIRTVMDELGILHLKDRYYYSLSGGEKQRVQLARVLVQIHDQETSVLFLDEPINGLDLLYQQLILEEAQEVCQKRPLCDQYPARSQSGLPIRGQGPGTQRGKNDLLWWEGRNNYRKNNYRNIQYPGQTDP